MNEAHSSPSAGADFRVSRHSLSARAPAGSQVETAGRICGLHAQVMSSADLSLWARVRGHRSGDLPHALWEERTLVKTWLMRGTLHAVPASDLPLYVGGLDNRGEYAPAWLRAFGVTAAQMERLIEAVEEALDGRCLVREELVEAVRPRVGTSVARRLRSGWGEFLKPAARRGLLCFGPSRGQKVTFVRPDQWLDGWRAPPGRTEARTELLRRFLAGYGPASPGDFERWIGALRRIREPWEALSGEIDEVAPKTFVLAADRVALARARSGKRVRLLPAFDPYVLHPHAARPVPAAVRDRVYRTAGWVSPVVLVAGRAVAVWSSEKRGARLAVEVTPFGRLPATARPAVEREAESLARYLGSRLELTVR